MQFLSLNLALLFLRSLKDQAGLGFFLFISHLETQNLSLFGSIISLPFLNSRGKKNIKITEIIKIIPKSYTIKKTKTIIGSGCGSVGRAVASDTRDPQYKSRHRQNIIYQLYNRKDRNKEKEARNGPSLKRENKNIFDLDRNFSHFRLVNKGSAKCLS